MKQTNKKIVILFALFLIVGFFLYQVQEKVLAEQSGSSPESGVTSRIKTIYDSLVSLSHGSDSAGGWGDWGVMWNRIRSAAEWVPSDTATETDVAEGKTFHNTSRIQKIGSASLAPDYGKQSLATKMELQSMYTQEESVWDDVAGSPFATYEAVNLKTGQVKKDIRTGLWWTAPSASPLSNVFTLASDGQRPTGGNAIAFCEALNTANFAGNNVWYLPTEKELMQAYVDGIYSQDHTFGNLTSAPWAPETWSSTDSIYDGFAVAGALYTPSFGSKNKTDTLSVRCVRRD